MRPFLLVANGDETLTRSVQRILNRQGYHVEAASGGLECVAKLRQARPDVLVLDLDIPWGGGEGVLEWLAEDQRGARPGAILLSGTPPTEQIMHLLIPPVVHYLQKPFSLRVLLRVVEPLAKPQALAASRQRSQQAPPFTAASALNGAAALVRSFDQNVGLMPAMPLAQGWPVFSPPSSPESGFATWGAVIEEINASNLSLTLCYPFPPGTCLAVELESPGSRTRSLAVRVLASEDQGERMWRLQCEYLPAMSESPLGFMPLQTQSV